MAKFRPIWQPCRWSWFDANMQPEQYDVKGAEPAAAIRARRGRPRSHRPNTCRITAPPCRVRPHWPHWPISSQCPTGVERTPTTTDAAPVSVDGTAARVREPPPPPHARKSIPLYTPPIFCDSAKFIRWWLMMIRDSGLLFWATLYMGWQWRYAMYSSWCRTFVRIVYVIAV